MNLAEALHNNRHTIVDKWVAYTLKTYQATEFLQREQDRFANPIGSMVRSSLKQLFPLLVQGSESGGLHEPLTRLMQLRAVQDFTPSQAVAPLNAVKHICREVLAADKQTRALIGDLYDFEFAVDLAVLAAFDLYMQCRENVYRVRIDELKSGSHILTDNACPSKVLKNIREIKK